MSINEIATISPVVRDDGWKKNGMYVVTEKCTRFSFKSIPEEYA